MGEQLFGVVASGAIVWLVLRSVVSGIRRGDLRWEEPEEEERVTRPKRPQYRVVKVRRYR